MTCDSPGRSQGGCRSALREDENMSLNTLRQIARNGIRTEPAPSRAGGFQVDVALLLRTRARLLRSALAMPQVDAVWRNGYEHAINGLRAASFRPGPRVQYAAR